MQFATTVNQGMTSQKSFSKIGKEDKGSFFNSNQLVTFNF